MVKLMTIISFVCLLAITCVPAARAEVSISTFNTYSKGNKTEKFGIEMYVGGMGNALVWANANLETRKQQQLFCGYDDKTTTDYFLKLTHDAIKDFLKKFPNDLDAPIELVLLLWLQKKYPCN